MENPNSKFLSSGNVAFVDTTADTISVSIAQNGNILHSISRQGGALENLFEIFKEIFDKTDLSVNEISAFGFCQGVGSILGIRTASATLSTFRAANPNSVCFTWDLLTIYAQILKASHDEFVIICPSRKNFANICIFENGNFCEKEIESKEIQSINLRKFFINQRKSSDKNFENLTQIFFDVSDIAKFLIKNENFVSICSPSEILDATVLAKREYVKWNSLAHS